MKTIVLTEAQHAHYSKLNGEDAEAFLAKSSAERDAVLAEIAKSDPVVYTTKSGLEVRKSHGDLAVQLAKQSDENAAAVAKQNEELAKRDAEIKKAKIRKVASEVLGGMPGDEDTHDFIIAALDIEDPNAQKALETLKGIVATSTIGKRAPGAGGEDAPTSVSKQDAYKALKSGLEAFCVEKKIEKVWVDGLDEFVKTPTGRALYDAHEAAKK